MKQFTLTPSASGNGFTAGKNYSATVTPSWNDSLLVTYNDYGHERFISRDSSGKPSAHLWDGKNWNKAGHFIIKEA